MPVGRETRLVAVPLQEFLYAFRTTCRTSTSTICGHIPAMTAAGAFVSGAVLGCNSPKPGKAKKIGTTAEGDSTYYDWATRPALLAADWDLTLPSYSSQVITTPRSKLLKVSASSGSLLFDYGWRLGISDYNLIGADIAALGVTQVAVSDLSTTCFGVNKPKPKRARKRIQVGEQWGNLSTFVGQARENSLPTGWTLLGSGGGRIGFTPTAP